MKHRRIRLIDFSAIYNNNKVCRLLALIEKVYIMELKVIFPTRLWVACALVSLAFTAGL